MALILLIEKFCSERHNSVIVQKIAASVMLLLMQEQGGVSCAVTVTIVYVIMGSDRFRRVFTNFIGLQFNKLA